MGEGIDSWKGKLKEADFRENLRFKKRNVAASVRRGVPKVLKRKGEVGERSLREFFKGKEERDRML